MDDNSQVVKEGVAVYDGTVQYGIKIVLSSVWPGSGDYEDPPDIRDDREVECYYAWHESPAEPRRFSSGAGPSATLLEAIEMVERATNGTVRWVN